MSKEKTIDSDSKMLDLIRENKDSERFVRFHNDKKSTDIYSAIDNNIDVFKRLKDR